MNRFFSAFPFLKKWCFFLLLFLLIFLIGLTGFLYLPETGQTALSFAEERDDLEKALTDAEAKLAFATEETRAALSEEKIFYESALKFELSPWSSYFAAEGLTLYAHLVNAEADEDTVKELEQILRERDKEGLYEFCKNKSPFGEIDLRQLSADDTPQTPGENALLYDVTLLEESLLQNKDLYFGTEKKLSEKDHTLLQNLLDQKEKKIAEKELNPIPANRETLATSEELTACLLTVLLLAVAGRGKKEEKSLSPLLVLSGVAFALTLICCVTLHFTALFFAPGTVEPEPLQWGGTLPFFPALLFRGLCRTMGMLPLILLCFYLRTQKEKETIWKWFSLLPPLLFLLQITSPIFPRGVASIFSLGNLSDCLFPPLSAYSLRPAAPWAGVLLWLITLLSSLTLWLKKEQKITDEKQKLSLEKQNEL